MNHHQHKSSDSTENSSRNIFFSRSNSVPDRRPYLIRNVSSSDVTKLWETTLNNQLFKVQLQYNVRKQFAIVYVNGQEVIREKRRLSLSFPKNKSSISAILPFRVEFQTGCIRIIRRRKILTSEYVYECQIGEELIPSTNEMISQLNTDSSAFNIRIKDVSVIREYGKSIGVYTIQTEYRDLLSIVQRRYSEFVQLNQVIRTLFKGSHMINTLPILPKKQSKWINHYDTEFLEERRSGLASYLFRLSGIQQAAASPEFLIFLDFDPLTGKPFIEQLKWQEKEAEKYHENIKNDDLHLDFDVKNTLHVTFEAMGPLGMNIDEKVMQNGRKIPIVKGIVASGVSVENYDTALTQVPLHSTIYMIGTECTISWTVSQIIQFLHATVERPLTISFIPSQSIHTTKYYTKCQSLPNLSFEHHDYRLENPEHIEGKELSSSGNNDIDVFSRLA